MLPASRIEFRRLSGPYEHTDPLFQLTQRRFIDMIDTPFTFRKRYLRAKARRADAFIPQFLSKHQQMTGTPSSQ